MKFFTFVFILIFSSLTVAGELATIAFYNVENMFDHIDDPNVDDSEFTPSGTNAWTEKKSLEKILKIGKVIYSLRNSSNQTPDIIGLAEVENARVIKTLLSIKEIKELGYDFVHFDSPDKRGIDVAFLYKKNRFSVESSSVIPVKMEGLKPTRDILKIIGQLDGESFVFYVNHWPSRSGGEAGTAPFRIGAGRILRKEFDDLMKINPNAKVMIMGDFNDNPNDKSLKNSLIAKTKLTEMVSPDLFNPYFALSRKGDGSNLFNDVWFNFDQIIISDQLINPGRGFRFSEAKVFRANFLFQTTGRYRGYPARSYSEGNIGYSDHLPVYINLVR